MTREGMDGRGDAPLLALQAAARPPARGERLERSAGRCPPSRGSALGLKPTATRALGIIMAFFMRCRRFVITAPAALSAFR